MRAEKGRTYSGGHKKYAKEATRGLSETAERSRVVGERTTTHAKGVEDERKYGRKDGQYARTLVCYYL